jgi:hypothetical protein
LRRVNREQTSLLNWLAESDTAGVLRDSGDVDLRDEAVIDVRADADVSDEAGQPVDSSLPR